ncbi:antitoxin VbhA family protein [Hymenobacter arizonensis]|uniref:Antitoxin VbhA domain-containing protein n=1 Tax=Hymenobacter arizonensis TaxID=1227077 RepID=A0A1I6BH61_HYMAR|nr:antitoxin VbhA family protein [Hymenobacter arizonensis]SFQ80282.1 hypothetical protein SAMN04515668_4562 [Hymenobacter arizonensis]
MEPSLLRTEAGRQRAVAFALALTAGTPLSPGPAERALLDQFVRGDVDLDAMLARLNAVDEGDARPWNHAPEVSAACL